jgi:hypothetical protein
MPNLEYVNASYVVRTEDTPDPYIKYSHQYHTGLKNSAIKWLTSFSDKPCFVAAIENILWIQGRDDLILCKGMVSQLLISSDSEYFLLCDEQGQFGCYSIASDDFTKYVDPVSRSLTCLALSDSQRIIVAGTDEAKFKLLNTLGQSKFTVSLIYTTSDDDDKVEGPVLRLFFKPDKTNIIGVVPHGIFTWNFESGGALDVAIVKKTTRTLTACAYIRNMDLIVAGDSEGLVTLSSSDSLDHPDKFQCDAPIVALSTHPTQPLIAIATETEIIVWFPTGGSFKVPHASLPIGEAKCTAIEWARTGGILFAGYSNGTVVHFVKCPESEVKIAAPEVEEKLSYEERRHKCGEAIYSVAQKFVEDANKSKTLAGKLTGMLLDLDLLELELMIKNEAWMIERLGEALYVLEKHC